MTDYNNSYADDYVPPTSSQDDSVMQSAPVQNPTDDVLSADDDQSLESQNIFEMLGAEEGTEEMKEQFLDELQEAVWSDFIDNEVKLLLNEGQRAEYEQLTAQKDAVVGTTEESDLQDKIIEFLEKSIEDFEEIMLEKALDLKSDLFIERILALRDLSANNPDAQSKLDEAEKLVSQDKWADAVKLVNQVAG